MSNGHISPLKGNVQCDQRILRIVLPDRILFSCADNSSALYRDSKERKLLRLSYIQRELPDRNSVTRVFYVNVLQREHRFKWMAKLSNSLIGGNEQQSGALDVSPDVLEHLAEFALGGAGAFGMRNLDAFEKWQKGEDLKAREIPFLRRIKGEPDERVSMGDFYERKIKLEAARS